MEATATLGRPVRQVPATVGLGWALRVAGAALLVTTALIHLHLYRSGYRGIPTIGRLFLANAAAGLAAGGAVLLGPFVLPPRFGPLTRLAALGGSLLEAGTLVGLIVTVTHGLFGFQDTSSAPYFTTSIVIEVLGALVLAALALLPVPRPAAG